MIRVPGCLARVRRRWSWELGVGGGLLSALSFSAVRGSEQERVFATLVLAFAADLVERWLYSGAAAGAYPN